MAIPHNEAGRPAFPGDMKRVSILAQWTDEVSIWFAIKCAKSPNELIKDFIDLQFERE